MICVELRDRVDELLDGLLAQEEALRLEKLAAACPSCAAELADAAKFLNFLDDDGREAIDTYDAANVTADVAQRVAQDAQSVRPGIVQLPVQRPAPRRWAWRAVAAALVVGAAVAFPYLRGSGGPEVLAVGRPVEISKGLDARIRDGVRVRASERAEVEIESGRSRERVALHRGAALFLTEDGEELEIVTPAGATFCDVNAAFEVAIRDDDALSVSVVQGEVTFAGELTRQLIRAGQRIEVTKDGAVSLLSLERVQELELRLSMRDNLISSLRGDRQRLEEQLAVLRAASGQRSGEPRADSIDDSDLDELPWRELAWAARVLLPYSRRYNDPERNRAMAVFLYHTKKIQELTGVENPIDGLYHPAFIARMADPFYAVLAPYAPASDRQAVAARVRSDAKVAHGKLRDELVPADNVAVRLGLFHDMLTATEEHLGERAAAELAEGLHVLDTIASVRVMRYTEHSAKDVAASWSRHYDLDEKQYEQLSQIAADYVAKALAAQESAAKRLGDLSDAVLFPNSQTLRVSGESDEDKLAFALKSLEAKLEIAAPRVQFERELRRLLREDQRARGFGRSWGLLTFYREQ